MNWHRIRRSTATLLVMIGLAGIYTGWLYIQDNLRNVNRLDGVIGALLGLYLASHPAGNMLDLLFFTNGYARDEILSGRAGRFWLALNSLVIMAAWFIIFIGITHLVRKTP
jgi:hypothetical protein